MIISGEEFRNVTIVDDDGQVIAVITDEKIIEYEGFEVLFDVGVDAEESEDDDAKPFRSRR